jgi:hypothetical protein
VAKGLKMTKTQKIKMYEDIEKHGANLNALFNTGLDNVKLAKKVYSLENKLHYIATDYCNGNLSGDDMGWKLESGKILEKLDKILGFVSKKIPVFANADCRGYSLKINDDYIKENNVTIYRDFGGYGIIAPDFTPVKGV